MEELQNSNVEVVYLIDKDGKNQEEIPVYSITDELPDVDVIVVSVVHMFRGIEADLKVITNNKVVSLEEVILDSLSN